MDGAQGALLQKTDLHIVNPRSAQALRWLKAAQKSPYAVANL
jgi:hypothetical protein